MHGSIATSTCTRCAASYGIEEVDALFDEDGVARCATCDGPVKPDVVLFGELLPESAMAMAQQLAERADLMLCVGSSLVVHPVAGLPRLTLERGGRLAIVTKGPTPYDGDGGAEAGRRGRRGAGRAAGGARLASSLAQNLTPASTAGVDDRFAGAGPSKPEARAQIASAFAPQPTDRFGADPAGDRDFDAAARWPPVRRAAAARCGRGRRAAPGSRSTVTASPTIRTLRSRAVSLRRGVLTRL